LNLFPYDEIREIQSDFMVDIDEALKSKKHLIAHAPTGLGKTAATIAPALTHALDNNLTVFFLTSRHTQHHIAIETIKAITERHKVKIKAIDIIGKKWMCLVPGIQLLYSGEFADYCKRLKETNACEFFKKTKKGTAMTEKASEVIKYIRDKNILACDDVIKICKENDLCPYEITNQMAKDADIIICDYNYIFNKRIRDGFFLRSTKNLEESILIIDEGHNVPARLREIMTARLSSNMLKSAIKEAKKLKYFDTIETLVSLQDILNDLSNGVKDQKIIGRDNFMKRVEDIKGYSDIVDDLKAVGDAIRETQRQSFVGSIATFLEEWLHEEKGFLRFIEVKNQKSSPSVILQNRCLDPSIVSKEVFEGSYSSILMSGTLTPTIMYRDILGFDTERTILKKYKSPFPQDNRLNLVIPKTSTKFSSRSESQYKEIAKICAEATDAVPGNCAIFFPSYRLRDDVYNFFSTLSKKTIFLEESGLGNEEKKDLLDRFKEYHKIGAVLLAVASGSFGEGIDLPGDYLKCVAVVGLPLNQPNLETKELIKYYDMRFQRGWDYGYIFPALNKVMQAAGRCIRSGTDRGAILFIDHRYVWDNYFKCFPIDWDVKISMDYIKEIGKFFKN